MIIYPAIDLKDGKCVRLVKGAMDQASVFNDDPAAQAASFVKEGAAWIHVVDLNGAFAGRPVNEPAVCRILSAVGMVPIQLGGGIRSMETIDMWLDAGVARVILGTVALKEPELVKAACAKHPGKIAVGIDARKGKVATEGWAETSEVAAIDLARHFEDAGVAAIIYTDIDRDGVLAGPNIEETVMLAQSVAIPVIASGGVSSLADIQALKAREADGISGVIVGRAIYDGRVDLGEALRCVQNG